MEGAFTNGSKTAHISIDYSVDHRRCDEDIPELEKRFVHDVALKIAPKSATKNHVDTAAQATTEAKPVPVLSELIAT